MSQLPFELTGLVVSGKQLGSKLGFPTANILYDPHSRVWPREGVYVGIAQVEGDERCYIAILNQGRHPTSPDGMPTVEAHLLGHPNVPLYGRQLTLSYRAFLRAETAFPSLDDLRSQLAQDRLSALAWAAQNAPHLTEGVNETYGV